MSDPDGFALDNEDEFLLNIDQTPLCPRCETRTKMVVRFSSSWKNGRAEEVPGLKEVVLCAACDHADPAAAELLALFTVDEGVTTSNMEMLGSLSAAWVESVRQRTVDEELLADEHERWLQGKL
ncbi:hypothetical protein QFZ22_000290 [Streptomyces canus]|uniref:Uncharacterized protein n=1 Tax=Streptomyces canus TaxID=58343 RepID=A0AAW8F4N5_9ACTN|nr:DUF6300 family protein [Streptomyces canus]MDQ0904305.1 hypothetical protein [Streptomyces canus]